MHLTTQIADKAPANGNAGSGGFVSSCFPKVIKILPAECLGKHEGKASVSGGQEMSWGPS